MVKRLRTLVSVPNSLKSNKALEESLAIHDHIDQNKKESFKFSVYKSQDVKDTLELLFNKKCAYCEQHYESITYLEIEHFRPKGRLRIEETKKSYNGYWWLAADWNNLLPSCPKCNKIQAKGIAGKVTTLGKGDYFPIAYVTPKLRKKPKKGDELYEVPLLINPTVDEPNDYISFKWEKQKSIVKSKNNNEFIEAKGHASIKYFALNRKGLVTKRTEELMKFKYNLYHLDKSINNTPPIGASFSIKREYLKDIKFEITSILKNFIDIKEHEFINAKKTHLIQWLSMYPKNTKNKLYRLLKL